MPIKVFCSHCGRPHVLADTLAGKRVHCKECERPFVVPGHEDDGDTEESPVETSRRGYRRKAKGGMPVWVWLLGGAAALLLSLGVGVLGLLYFLGAFGSVSEANFAKLEEDTSRGEISPPSPSPRPQLPAPPPAVQAPNRGRAPNPGDEFGIRMGMTEAELIAKLGPPDQTTDEPGKRSLRWFKGKRVIGVTLIGGKATGMGFGWQP